MKIKLSELRKIVGEEVTQLKEAPGSRPQRGQYAVGNIYLPTDSAMAIFQGEIKGQLSDGMWENSTPHDHWLFWGNMEPLKGLPKVVASERPVKDSYNLAALIPIVGDRMINVGRMAKGGADVSSYEVRRASEEMPATLEEFMRNKETGSWRSDYLKKYMETITPEMAEQYYAVAYTEKDLRKDLLSIKQAMKNVQYAKDPSAVKPEPVVAPVSEPEALTATPDALPAGPGGKEYKVYGKKGSSPAHTRFKGKAYVAGTGTKFKSGDKATVAPEGDKLRVKQTTSDHTQFWDPES